MMLLSIVDRAEAMLQTAYGWFTAFPWMGTLLVLMCLDILTGFIAAYNTRTLNSSITLKGMNKKVGVVFLVIMVAVLNRQIPDIPGVEMLGLFYSAWEATSIVENLGQAGVPLPPGLKDALVRMRDWRITEKDPMGSRPVVPPVVDHKTIVIVTKDPPAEEMPPQE